jgi:hypothetical protein
VVKSTLDSKKIQNLDEWRGGENGALRPSGKRERSCQEDHFLIFIVNKPGLNS